MNAPTREPIRAVLFDLDDTLWPITPVIERAEMLLFDWLSEQVPRVTERYTMAALRARRSELMAAHPRFRVDLWALRHAALHEAFVACDADTSRIDEAMKVFTTARNQVMLFDDVLVCLPRLAERVTLGSLTNGAADLRQIGLNHHSVYRWLRMNLAAPSRILRCFMQPARHLHSRLHRSPTWVTTCGLTWKVRKRPDYGVFG